MFMRFLASLLTACLIAPAFAQEDETPVKVFILAGQSNMEGKGAVNTLDHIGDDAEHGHLLATIKNKDGSWVVRDDVFIDYLGRSGPLTVGYGSKGGPHGGKIGPELGFGTVIGDAIEAPVLLIKTAWGGKDVAKDFLPPSLGGPGEFWTKMMDNVQRVLGNIDSVVPDYNNRGYEIAGFVWFQGWNDMVDREKTARYSYRFIHFIDDLRTELGIENLPVVIGELGVDGNKAKGGIATFREAQKMVASINRYRGNVRYVETAPYWDWEADQMFRDGVWKKEDEKEKYYRIASDRPYHYLGSGKIYFMMGHAFGQGMKRLVAQQ